MSNPVGFLVFLAIAGGILLVVIAAMVVYFVLLTKYLSGKARHDDDRYEWEE